MAAQRVVRELELVALADEEAERPLEVARRLGRGREAAREQLGRGGELVVLAVPRARRAMWSRVDAELAQPALDPLGAPAVEVAPVLGEAARRSAASST